MAKRKSSNTSTARNRGSQGSPLVKLTTSVERLEQYARTAKKNGFRLASHAFYGPRAWDGLADVRRNLLILKHEFTPHSIVTQHVTTLEGELEKLDLASDPSSLLKSLGTMKFLLKSDLAAALPRNGYRQNASGFLPPEIVPNGVYRRVLEEVNKCYSMECYNATAGMLRRLIESLIIEAFEAHDLGARIKIDGEYLELKGLIGRASAQQQLRLGRNTKEALPKLKFFGDMGLHSRSNLVREGDLKRLHGDVRFAIEELATHIN